MFLVASVCFVMAAEACAQTAKVLTNTEQRAAIEAEYGVRDAVVRYDTDAEFRSDMSMVEAEYCDYPFPEAELSKAPKGYKPVYISFIGRHGSRYALSDGIYEKMHTLFSEAHAAGKLTEAGEKLRESYEALYPYVAFRGGDLSAKGEAQWRRIADEIYHNFPEVFRGKTRIEVISTPVPRVMMSMFCFLDEIRGLDRDAELDVDAGRVFYPVLEPNKSTSPVPLRAALPGRAMKSAADFMKSKVDPEGFCSRFFTDPQYVERIYGGMWDFEYDLRKIVVDKTCLDGKAAELSPEGLFTPEELYGIWQVHNYNGYVYMGRTPLTDNRNCHNNARILDDMMSKADRDLASGDVRLNLKFSHDTALMPLLCFMRLNNFGAVVDDPEDVKNWWRADFVPMASNLQFIFYRSSRSQEILVKVLYNGVEASLPFDETAPGFYSWTEFRNFYSELISAADVYSER